MGYLVLFLLVIIFLAGFSIHSGIRGISKAVTPPSAKRTVGYTEHRPHTEGDRPPTVSPEVALDKIERFIDSLKPHMPEREEGKTILLITNRALSTMLEEIEAVYPLEYYAPERGWAVLDSSTVKERALRIPMDDGIGYYEVRYTVH